MNNIFKLYRFSLVGKVVETETTRLIRGHVQVNYEEESFRGFGNDIYSSNDKTIYAYRVNAVGGTVKIVSVIIRRYCSNSQYVITTIYYI